MEFGYELPQRPASWFRKQDRQARVRDELEEVMVAHVKRRLYRIFFADELELIPEEERQEEKAIVWGQLHGIALKIVAGRRSA